VGRPAHGSALGGPDSGPSWVKSSLSLSDGSCVEVASLPDGEMGVRYDGAADGPVLRFTPNEWRTFLGGVRNGEFDRFGSLDLAMTRRRATPSDQIQALTDTNAALQADNAQLERDNAGLKADNDVLRQKVKSLQVTVTVLLASGGGLGVGLATSMAGATVQTALASATGVFFAVIMASIAILTFMRR
jgi:hypothetical protein